MSLPNGQGRNDRRRLTADLHWYEAGRSAARFSFNPCVAAQGPAAFAAILQ
jgi:hypothetical protein